MGKRGPAPKGEYAGQSQVFSTRIRPDLRRQLQGAAKASGRSLSQEVSYRLRRTFIEDDKIEAAFGGRENYLVMRMVGLAMQWGAMTLGRDSTVWMHDPGLFDVVVKSVNGVLEQIRPSPEAASASVQKIDRASASFRNIDQDAIDEFHSKQVPAVLLNAIQEADPALPINEGTRLDRLMGILKAELGGVVARSRLTPLTSDDAIKIRDKHRRKNALSSLVPSSDGTATRRKK